MQQMHTHMQRAMTADVRGGGRGELSPPAAAPPPALLAAPRPASRPPPPAGLPPGVVAGEAVGGVVVGDVVAGGEVPLLRVEQPQRGGGSPPSPASHRRPSPPTNSHGARSVHQTITAGSTAPVGVEVGQRGGRGRGRTAMVVMRHGEKIDEV